MSRRGRDGLGLMTKHCSSCEGWNNRSLIVELLGFSRTWPDDTQLQKHLPHLPATQL